jgi:hypothetical protein
MTTLKTDAPFDIYVGWKQPTGRIFVALWIAGGNANDWDNACEYAEANPDDGISVFTFDPITPVTKAKAYVREVLA